jgi:alkaline phosphatase D
VRIAFASCICAPIFTAHPVCDWIAGRQPDNVALLGDSIHLDRALGAGQLQDMSDDPFAQHLWPLHSQLLAKPQFRTLTRQLPAGMGRTAWNDHGFPCEGAHDAETTTHHVRRPRATRAGDDGSATRQTLLPQ